MRLARWIGALALVLAVPAFAQSGVGALGYAIGAGPRTRQNAYADEQMRMLQQRALIEQIRAEESQADQADALANIRAALRNTWLRGGVDEAHASAYARAYHFADDDQAVWLSVEGRSPQQTGGAIRRALDARNFQLADQLLLGAIIESTQQPAPVSSAGR